MPTIDLGTLQDRMTKMPLMDLYDPKMRSAFAMETIALAMTGIFEQLIELNSYHAVAQQKQVYDSTAEQGPTVTTCARCRYINAQSSDEPCVSCTAAPTKFVPKNG